MTPLRLAVFVPSLRGGGAERVMLNLANGFAQSGHSVDLVLAQSEGPYLSDIGEGLRVHDLKARRVRRSVGPLAKYLRRERPDALISAMHYANVAAVIARSVARATRSTRLVLSEHNHLSSDLPSQSRGLRWVLPRAMTLTYPRATKVVTVSEGVAADLAKFLPADRAKPEVVYNPVSVPNAESPPTDEAPHPWLASDTPPCLLAVGRLNEQKDFGTLIEAFALLRQRRPAKLLILGEGPQRPVLEQQVAQHGLQDDVALPGFVDAPHAYMRWASALVLSSAWEGLPTVLVEAMSVGLPVVSTDCPSGPREILEDGRWGRLVPVGSPRALADATIETLDDTSPPDVRLRAADFSVEKAMRGYLRAAGLNQDS